MLRAKRQPQDERALPEGMPGLVQKESCVGIAEEIPATSHVPGDVYTKKRVDDLLKRFIDADGMDDERVTKIKDGFLAKTEFADGGAVGRLDTLAIRQYPVPVFLAELPVVGDQQPWPLKQRIVGFGPTGARIEPETT